jgi:hypothetical protein
MWVGPEFWRNHQELIGALLAIFGELQRCQKLLQDELLLAWFAIYQAVYNVDPPQ